MDTIRGRNSSKLKYLTFKISNFWTVLKWLFIFGKLYENMWNLVFLLFAKFQLFPGFPTNLKNHHFREKYDELCPNGGPVDMTSEFQNSLLIYSGWNLNWSKCENFTIFLSLGFYVKPSLGNLQVVKLPFLPHMGPRIW